MTHLAQVQLRSLVQDGGLDLPAMSDMMYPPFYAAHTRHCRQLLQEGVRGPYLLPAVPLVASSSLFSASFHQAQDAFLSREPIQIRADSDIHPPLLPPDMVLPHLNLFLETDVASAMEHVS